MVKYKKELLHFNMLHDAAPETLEDLDIGTRKKAEGNNEILKNIYSLVTDWVISEHVYQPFSHVYFEGYDGYYQNHQEILNENIFCLNPLRELVRVGCRFELTEHPGFNLLLVSYNRKLRGVGKAIEYLNLHAKGKDIEGIMRDAREYSDNPGLVQEFLDGEEVFDFGAIREKWIGRNIEKTLKENERGILFLGRNHKEAIIRDQLNNCKYSVEDLFADW